MTSPGYLLSSNASWKGSKSSGYNEGKKQTIFNWNAIVLTAKISNEVKDLPVYSSGEKKSTSNNFEMFTVQIASYIILKGSGLHKPTFCITLMVISFSTYLIKIGAAPNSCLLLKASCH